MLIVILLHRGYCVYTRIYITQTEISEDNKYLSLQLTLFSR